MAEKDLISVVMPNYNTPIPFLAEAVDSILAQTYQNFEFIIIDDCSTDESYRYLQSLTDPRIRLIHNKENMGVTASLNRGFRLAKGAYIARMDSDDVSLPNRFERQLEYMNAHKDVIVCGTFAEEIGDKNGKRCRHIPEQKEYQCGVLFGNVYGLIHPTAFFRASVLRENGIQYDENIPTAQDYAMWAECCRYGEIANVEEILFQYRVHQKQISTAKRELQQRCTMYVQKKILNHLFPDISDQTVRVHFDYCTSCRVTSDMRRWFQTIAEANDVARYVDREALLAFIGQFLCNKALVSANQTGNPIALCELLMRSAKAERKVVLQSIAARLSKKLRH